MALSAVNTRSSWLYWTHPQRVETYFCLFEHIYLSMFTKNPHGSINTILSELIPSVYECVDLLNGVVVGLVTYWFEESMGVVIAIWTFTVDGTWAGLDRTGRNSSDNDRGTFWDWTVIICVLFFGLCVSDLQVAVSCSELLFGHDQPLEFTESDVETIKHHRIIAKFRREFIMNMSHYKTGQTFPKP